MAKKAKTHYIGGRVDDDFRDDVLEYIEAAEMSMGELIRASLKEFMFAHPIRDSAGEFSGTTTRQTTKDLTNQPQE